MIPTFDKIHNKFRLNGTNYNHEELKEVAYSLVKEGLPFEKVIGDFLMDWLNPKDFIIVKTSGSTGKPKRINLKKQAMVNSAIATGDFFKLQPGYSALHCLPTKYIAGKMMLIRALIIGLELDMVKPSSQPMFDYDKHYDFCAMIPLQLQRTKTYINNIKIVIVGGAKVSEDLIDEIQALKTKVYETYGMTETITHIAAKRLNFKREAFFNVLPNIIISVDDRDCLVIVAKHISEKTVVTNDIVKIHSETTFEWLGRIDNVINSGGIKMFPELLEAKLHDRIKERFFITSMDDDELGKKLILVIEAGSNQLDSDVFKGFEKHEIPKHIFAIKKFIETPSQKIKRLETLSLIE